MIQKIDSKKRTLIVDGSILIYRIASALEQATQWEDDMWTLHADLKLGKKVLDTSLRNYQDKLNCNKTIIAQDHTNNFRLELSKEYKANREVTELSEMVYGLKDVIIKNSDLIYDYSTDVDVFIVNLLKEGCSVRGVSRVLKISKDTVLSRMQKISKQILKPSFRRLGYTYEIDEMWSFIGNKKNVLWITYVLEKETGSIIDFHLGRKTKETLRPLIDKVLLLNPRRIYTDRLNIYPSLIPKEIQLAIMNYTKLW